MEYFVCDKQQGGLSTSLSWRIDRHWWSRPSGALIWSKIWLLHVFFFLMLER